jgi:hypothetical protein
VGKVDSNLLLLLNVDCVCGHNRKEHLHSGSCILSNCTCDGFRFDSSVDSCVLKAELEFFVKRFSLLGSDRLLKLLFYFISYWQTLFDE